MQEQEKVGRVRMIGYAIGLAAVAVVLAWKWLVR